MTASLTFDYQAIDAAGARSGGTLTAASEAAAIAVLRQQGQIPLQVTASGKGMSREIHFPGRSSRVRPKDLAVFTRQFATMVNSGLSLLRSLHVLHDQIERPALKSAIDDVTRKIESGSSLSDAMAAQDDLFPVIMVAMIRAGETGGFLDEALERIAITMEKDVALRGKIKTAMTYPVIVLAFAGLMIAGVLMFIVPIFERMFAQFDSQLPLPTLILVRVSHALVWLGPLLIVAAAVGVTLFKRALKTRPPVRLGFDRLKLRVPVFGALLTKIAVGRFARNLGILLGSGVPVMQALEIVGATTGNAVMTHAMVEVGDAVRQGGTMTAPIARQDIFPPILAQMVEVGEESGRLSQMLGKVADFYDREVDQAAEALTAAIEPIMVLFMGVVVGGMVVCLYLPMFTIYQNIQGAS